MIENIKKGILPTIIALSALAVSTSAAFYSVSGLSKLFAGASYEVMIMAGSLEVAKLVIASLLYKYWDTINKLLRAYLVIAAIVLVLITSMGIYGFLSAAYQDTYRGLEIKTNQTEFLTQKKGFYEKDVIRYDKELERISNNISTLSDSRSQSIQIRDTSVAGGFRQSVSTSGLRIAQKRIEVEEENRKAVQVKRERASDSLQKYQLQILDLDNNSEVAGELGPLQYISGLTGAPMDKIINILLLVIIFVFDPLAISLVIAANFAFEKAYPRKQENIYGEKLKEDTESWDEFIETETYEHESATLDEQAKEAKEVYNEEVKNTDGDMDVLANSRKYFPSKKKVKEAKEVYDEEVTEERMKVIGQNGNTGEHYQEKKVVEIQQPTRPSTHADRYKRKDDNNTKKTYM